MPPSPPSPIQSSPAISWASGRRDVGRQETAFALLLATRDWNSQAVDIDDKNPIELVASSQSQETGMITGTISQIRKLRLKAVNACLKWHR